MVNKSAFNKLERDIEKEESKLGKEFKKEEKGIEWFMKSHTFKLILLVAVFVVLISAVVYLTVAHGRVYVEKSELSAAVIPLSSPSGGIIEKVFVKEGDFVAPNTVVAQVSGTQIKTKIGGLVVGVDNSPGKLVTAMSPVVEMIDPQELRVVGHVEEDKGLSDIRAGQEVEFTVDAFGSKKYEGIVESVSPRSRESAVVFSISDKRGEKEFDVKVKFNVYAYPELKDGMSAKMWIYK